MVKTILIADDNDDLRSMLGFQLQQNGYRVLMATDGNQAIAKARSEKPDLILLDVLMPGMDGTEAGAELKSDPSTSKIPVIFLTSLVQGDEPSPMSDVGDEFVVPKSIQLEDLLAKIKRILTPPPDGRL